MELKYLLEALRTKPQEPGVYRQPGYPARRVNAGSPTKNTSNSLNYVKYKRQQSAMGEEPVSYEEWMKGQ